MEKSDQYSDVELTEDEIFAALQFAKQKKSALLKEVAYREKLSKPIQYPTFTSDRLGEIILSRMETIMPDFVIDDDNRKVFTLLCQYFTGDKEFERLGYSLTKGILLVGPVGCGKTTLMRCFTANQVNSFVEITCRQVADDYSLKETGGANAIAYYSSLKEVYAPNFFGQKQVGMFFDDLGTENTKKHFGNEVNVMAEVILNRYDSLATRDKTHLTTNLSADEIEEYYGTRVRSRLREMCNWIPFNPKTADRRK